MNISLRKVNYNIIVYKTKIEKILKNIEKKKTKILIIFKDNNRKDQVAYKK